jgi:hypothetical protein
MKATRIGNEEAINQLAGSLRSLLDFERFHLHNTDFFQDKALDPAFDTRYLPQNCGAIELPCFWVLRKYLYVYGQPKDCTMALDVVERDGLNERVLFPIHPTALDRYRQFLSEANAVSAASEGLRLWAVPTSSVRTFLVWPDHAPEKAFFVKTSLHSPIFGDRRLHARKVACSVGLSSLVHHPSTTIPSALTCFPEPVGFVPRCMMDSGAIIRSIPGEIKSNAVVVIPLFALFGEQGNHSPLLLTILRRSGMEALDFVEHVLCAPFARLWLQMSFRWGLILEAHGQDVLLALSPEMEPLHRFYYRDFEGLRVDWDTRRRCGLIDPDRMPRAFSWYETYETVGYRYSDSAWYKLGMSVYQYLQLVLNELDASLQAWQARGLLCEHRIERARLTKIFSRELMNAIEESFGVRPDEEYDIYHSPKRFMIFLQKLRRDLSQGRVASVWPDGACGRG